MIEMEMLGEVVDEAFGLGRCEVVEGDGVV